MRRIVGHRGLREKGTKENSLDSIKLALKKGIDIIEIDIQKTRDCLILRHDTRRFGLSIKKMRFNPKKFISFDEALKVIPKTVTIIADIKIAGIEKELIAKLKGRKVIYFSHIKKVLLKIKRLDPQAKIGIYYINKVNLRAFLRRLRFVSKFLKIAKRYSADIIAVPGPFVTKKLVDRAKKEGFELYIYGLFRKKYIKKAYELGVYALEIDKVKDLEYVKSLKSQPI
jgi:glycerophosphoryl diester phosphodiesterase